MDAGSAVRSRKLTPTLPLFLLAVAVQGLGAAGHVLGAPWLAVLLPAAVLAAWLRWVATTCFDGGGVLAFLCVIALAGVALGAALSAVA